MLDNEKLYRFNLAIENVADCNGAEIQRDPHALDYWVVVISDQYSFSIYFTNGRFQLDTEDDSFPLDLRREEPSQDLQRALKVLMDAVMYIRAYNLMDALP